MSNREVEARNLIERIADKVRPDARQERSIQLLLDSFAPDHVLTELLQNADDAGATTVEIKLTDEGIYFAHDGREFNEADLHALCDVGVTTKKPGVHIGFMGIGFKAAFKISDKPHVFSGPYRFYFTREDVIVPHWLDEVPPDVQAHLKKSFTAFFLPYRQDLPSEIIESLKETVFTKLEPLCLVFLRNVTKITITSHADTRVLVKVRGSPQESLLNKERISVTEKRGSKERAYDYLIFNKTLEVPEYVKEDYRAKDSRRAELKTTVVTIAFTVKDGVVEPERSVLYTFLPTPFETGLRFAVNCDFILNTQRTEIDFTSKWNLWLLESIGDTLKEIVRRFIQDEKQRLSFYDVLPREKEVSRQLFDKIAKPLIDYMRNNPSIITADGGLAKPSEVVLASEEVQKIIPPEKANAQCYASAKIRGKAFLKEELGVKDLTEGGVEREYVFEALRDKEWLASLSGAQARAIYEFLYRKLFGDAKDSWGLSWLEHRDAIDELKKMEIVKCSDGLCHRAEETIIPGEQGEQLKGLTSIPCLIFVDPTVLSDQSRELLKNLGAMDFTEESIISRILSSQAKGDWKEWTSEGQLTIIGYIARWLDKIDYKIPEGVKHRLGDLVLPVEGGGWAKAADCYVSTPELKEILPSANYVDPSAINRQVENARRFLEAIGVLNYPRVLQLGERKLWLEPPEIRKDIWRGYCSWLISREHTHMLEGRDHRITALCLDGFDECASSQDVGKLTRYLNFLLEHWDDYYNLYKNSSHHWFYYYEQSEDVPSYFAYQLKTHKWLPTTKGLARPDEVFAPIREIKGVGGDLIPYLRIPEERARQKKELLQSLGIQTEINLPVLLSILSKARDAEVNDDLKAQLKRVYQKMATLCEGEEIKEEVYILDTKGNFQNSKTLYWLDDSEAESAFGEELPAAWVPRDMSRPQLEMLFNALGVTSISSILERRRIRDGQEIIDDELTSKIRKRADYLYSVLLHHKAGGIEAFPDFVREAVVVRVDQLRVELKVLDKVREIKAPAFCSVEEKRIYVSSEAGDTDIARELARAFKAPGSEFTLGFVLTQTLDVIREQLRRSSIQLMSLPEPIEPGVLERTSTRATIKPLLSTTDKGGWPKEAEDIKQLPTEGKISTTEPSEGMELHTTVRDEKMQKLGRASEKAWAPECRPEEVQINKDLTTIIKPQGRTTDISRKFHERVKAGHISKITIKEEPSLKETKDSLTEEERREVGRWGEEFVLYLLRHDLQRKYADAEVEERKDEGRITFKQNGTALAEISWLNHREDAGMEYDIKLMEGGEEKYIEVKATTHDNRSFSISPNQWRFAVQHSENYIIYRVFGAGTRNARGIILENPAQLWMEGQLEIKGDELQMYISPLVVV